MRFAYVLQEPAPFSFVFGVFFVFLFGLLVRWVFYKLKIVSAINSLFCGKKMSSFIAFTQEKQCPIIPFFYCLFSLKGEW